MSRARRGTIDGLAANLLGFGSPGAIALIVTSTRPNWPTRPVRTIQTCYGLRSKGFRPGFTREEWSRKPVFGMPLEPRCPLALSNHRSTGLKSADLIQIKPRCCGL